MPAADHQGFFSSSVPLSSLGFSILSIRRDQVHPIDPHIHMAVDHQELLAFQRCVTDHFLHLSDADADGLLSLSWLRKLLHAYLVCHEEFRALLDRGARIARPPLDRLIADFSDRAVKALDILNATRDGIDQLRRCRAHVEIVVAALGPDSSGHRLGEGQVRRARKALNELAIMIDDRDAGHPHRNRSFDRSGGSGSSNSSFAPIGSRRISHFRSSSSSVSRSWSAARQLQAIGSNVAAPRDHEVYTTAGLAVPIYTMNSVLSFAMRSLVAVIPCQDRCLQAHFSVPRTYTWAMPVMSLHERIVEESKKKDRKNSTSLLKEMQQIERCTHHLMEATEIIQFPMPEEQEEELRQTAEELALVCKTMKEGLDILERQVREIFIRIARCRTESLDCLSYCAH
ncbi:hypothetical protein Cni_G11044 [Canna indica]|uniref:Uncharacterized protein n=1 Tax=Canna indica TaxID=4628 RepID=A0AAQ3QBA6_9LILI|nr:hypothetical protein Cni_G11044 [Canna indica]